MESLLRDVLLVKALILLLVAYSLGDINPAQHDYNIDEVKWGLTNDNKTDTCIILNGIFQVIIPYEAGNGLTGLTLLTVPRNASVSGSCGEFIQEITLTWEPASGVEADDPPTNQHSLTFTFIKLGEVIGGKRRWSFSEPFYELDSVDGVFYAGEAEFPNFNRDKSQYSLHAMNLSLLSAPLDLSYFCQATQVIYSKLDDTSLVMSFTQAQAFHQGLSDTGPDGVDFGPRSYCPTDGFQMIFSVAGYVAIFALLGAGIFLLLSRRKSRSGYVYL